MRKISILNRTDMSTMIKRSIFEPIRQNLNWEEKWRQNDHGLIICWEVGRKLKDENPEIAQKVAYDQLPTLPWKGGLDKPTKKGHRFGSLNYLAMWLGIRNEDLFIDFSEEYTLICSATKEKVTFTFDTSKYVND